MGDNPNAQVLTYNQYGWRLIHQKSVHIARSVGQRKQQMVVKNAIN